MTIAYRAVRGLTPTLRKISSPMRRHGVRLLTFSGLGVPKWGNRIRVYLTGGECSVERGHTSVRGNRYAGLLATVQFLAACRRKPVEQWRDWLSRQRQIE